MIMVLVMDVGGLLGIDEIIVNVFCFMIIFVVFIEGGSIEGIMVDVEVNVMDFLFGME